MNIQVIPLHQLLQEAREGQIQARAGLLMMQLSGVELGTDARLALPLVECGDGPPNEPSARKP